MTHSIKTILLGPSSVGKTSITNYLDGQNYNPSIENTIGCSFVRLCMGHLTFDIWDTAGQERFMSISPLYYRNASIIIFVFDVSDLSTIDTMAKYIKYYHDHSNNWVKEFVIIGNKIDKIHATEDNFNLITKKLKTHPIIKHYNMDNIPPLYISVKKNTNMSILKDTLETLGQKFIPPPDPRAPQTPPFPSEFINHSRNPCSCG